MSKRVYEIARELDLSTKEVIDRLNDAGLEVKSHFAVVEDPLVESVWRGHGWRCAERWLGAQKARAFTERNPAAKEACIYA